MIEALKKLEEDARQETLSLSDPKALEGLRVKYLGRRGLFAALSSRIAEVPPDARRPAGQEMNRVKTALEAIFSEKEKALVSGGPRVPEQKIDVTMPGTFHAPGTLHPLTRVILDIARVFERL
ncbi:MAG: hypothetical protein HYT89_04560, partial [Candidatus Omnitrophica bacterium]|nr:hypothetical protein [Candidatus Omnitrophota bacterium]